MFLEVIIIVLSLLFAWMKWNYSYWSRKNVPCLKPTLLFGNIGSVLTLKKHFGALSEEWYNEVPYFGYYRAFTPAISIRDPELIKNILVKDQSSFSENDIGFDEKVDTLLAHNPFMVADEKWKVSRGLLTPLFTPTKVKQLFPLMADPCLKLKNYVTTIGSTTDVDSKDLAAKFTTQNVGCTAFSLDAECFGKTESEFRIMGKKIFQADFWQAVRMTISIFLPALVKIIHVPFLPKEVDQWIRNLVKQNVNSRKITKPTRDDLLQMLLNISEKNSLTEEQITGHALAFFTEGYETSSTILGFAMYEMACHQDLQENLFEEISEVLEKHNGELTYDAIQEMTYLDCVFSETLRMRPVAMTLHKLCTKRYELPQLPGQDKPLVIEKGCPVTINIYGMHMDPNYFPDPEIFDPQRFTEEQRKTHTKGVYIPFGDGPRMCLGMRFALAQIKAALATLVLDFNIKVSPNSKPFELEPKSFLYQSKEPLLLNFIPRN